MNGIEKTDILTTIDFQAYYAQYFHPLRIKKTGGWSENVLCPFHADTRPSFGVNLEKGHFCCLACSARGDIFDFHRKYYGVDFKRAVADLGAFAGLSNEQVKPKTRAEIQKRKFEQWKMQYVSKWISNKIILFEIMIADAQDILGILFERGNPLPDYFGWLWEKIGQWETQTCQLEAKECCPAISEIWRYWNLNWSVAQAIEDSYQISVEKRIAGRLRAKWMELKGCKNVYSTNYR